MYNTNILKQNNVYIYNSYVFYAAHVPNTKQVSSEIAI